MARPGVSPTLCSLEPFYLSQRLVASARAAAARTTRTRALIIIIIIFFFFCLCRARRPSPAPSADARRDPREDRRHLQGSERVQAASGEARLRVRHEEGEGEEEK